MFSSPQYTSSELQQHDYFVMQDPGFESESEAPVCMLVQEGNGVLYCVSQTSEGVYCYSYVLNNPLKFIDPSGYRAQPKELWDHIRNYNFDFPYSDWVQPYKVKYQGGGGNSFSDRNTFIEGTEGSGWVPNTELSTINVSNSTDVTLGALTYVLDGTTYISGVSIVIDGVPHHIYFSGSDPDSNSGDARALTLSGLTLLTQEGLEVFQGSNQGVRAAAIRNGIPTEAIDDIIRRTGNFQNISKWAGRGFIAAGVVVNVIDGVQAYKNGDQAGMVMAGMDLLAGLGTAAIGGPVGIILYGGYMLIMHAPVVAEPAFMSDPTSNWNRLPRIDNTYVAPSYQY